MQALVSSRRRAGFTLVEALVVVSILAVLFSLTTAAVIKALQYAEDARVPAEIRQLENGITAFKAHFGASYIPSHITLRTDLSTYTNTDPDWQYLTSIWPRMERTKTSGATPVKQYVNWGQINSFSTQQLTYELQGHQCLAFFLGGRRFDNGQAGPLGGYIGFSSNPQNPMAPPSSLVPGGESRIGPFYDFVVERIDTTRNQLGGYLDAYSAGNPYGQGRPYFYFSAYKTGYKPEKIFFAGPPSPNTPSIPVLVPTNYFLSPFKEPNNGRFFNPDSFQIICAGRDNQVSQIAGSSPSFFKYMEWKNGQFGGTTPVANPKEAQDDWCNFHPVRMGTPQ